MMIVDATKNKHDFQMFHSTPSSKFWRKLVYVKTLEELYQLVPVERAAVPDKVKNYDCRHS